MQFCVGVRSNLDFFVGMYQKKPHYWSDLEK